MSCDEIQQKLTPFLFRELKVDATHKIQEHVRECPACHVEAERLTRAIRFLKVDLGVEPPPERMERLLAEFRPKFSARSSQKSFRVAGEGSGGRSFQVTWTGLASALVPTLAIAGLVFMADAGGIRTRLFPPQEEPDAGAGGRPKPPEWERRPDTTTQDPTGSDKTPGPDAGNHRPDESARVDKMLDALQLDVLASWEKDASLPPSDSIVDGRDRSALGSRTDVRGRLLPREAPPERMAAGLLIDSSLFAEAGPGEVERLAAVLTDPNSPGFLLLAALRAATIWKSRDSGPTILALVADPGRPASVRTAAAKALAACHGGGPLDSLVAVAVGSDTPEETREAVLAALGRLEVDESTEALRSIVDQADRPDVRLGALHLVGDRTAPAEVEFVLESLARFEDPRDQIRVLEIAGRIGGDHARIYISQNVVGYGGHPEPVLRAAVAQLVAISRRLDTAESTLGPIAQNQGLPASVRATALAGIPGRDAAKGLVDVLRSGGDGERASAAEMLRWIPAAAGQAEALAAAFADTSPEVRRSAALAFATGGHAPKEALLALVQNDGATEVRAAGLAALAATGEGLDAFAGDPGIVQAAIEEILALPDAESDWTAYQAAEALPDPYGRTLVRFEPRRLLDATRRAWGVPYEIEADERIQGLLARPVSTRIAPPFLSRREFLAEMLSAAGLAAETRGDRVTIVLAQ